MQGLTFEQHQDFQKKQADLAKPENKYLADLVDGTVDYYFQSVKNINPNGLGSSASDKATKAKVADMKKYVTFSAQTLVEKGQRPTKQDITNYATDYLKGVGGKGGLVLKEGFFSDTKRTPETLKIADIPETSRTMVEKMLIKSGQSVTDQSVKMAYYYLKQAGKIQ
jgi:hypothetical protein